MKKFITLKQLAMAAAEYWSSLIKCPDPKLCTKHILEPADYTEKVPSKKLKKYKQELAKLIFSDLKEKKINNASYYMKVESEPDTILKQAADKAKIYKYYIPRQKMLEINKNEVNEIDLTAGSIKKVFPAKKNNYKQDCAKKLGIEIKF